MGYNHIKDAVHKKKFQYYFCYHHFHKFHK